MTCPPQPASIREGGACIDLGSDHWLRFTAWKPDMSIPANAGRYAHLSLLMRDYPIVGAMVRHHCRTETGVHEGHIQFVTPVTDANEDFRRYARWTVESWEPLTIAPSLLSHCPCNDHGFIREGRWIKC